MDQFSQVQDIIASLREIQRDQNIFATREARTPNHANKFRIGDESIKESSLIQLNFPSQGIVNIVGQGDGYVEFTTIMTNTRFWFHILN